MFRYTISPKKLYPSQRLLSLALMGTLLASGYSEQAAALGVSAPSISPDSFLSSIELSQARPTPRPSRQIIRRVRLDLSER
ncbi:MAG: hypothetical protein HC781_09615 [Leptolyngbyaceae cyanobacterium CSU_1_4]|nr:hypothetical protein [Leptolyngbyaceae cyanobacterium CSU_1_4]